jgi:hypothetical protein
MTMVLHMLIVRVMMLMVLHVLVMRVNKEVCDCNYTGAAGE